MNIVVIWIQNRHFSCARWDTGGEREDIPGCDHGAGGDPDPDDQGCHGDNTGDNKYSDTPGQVTIVIKNQTGFCILPSI